MKAPTASMRVAVIGCGFIGLPAAVLAVSAGHTVVAFDTDPDRIDQLHHGYSYLPDVSDHDLDQALATGRLIPTGNTDALAGFDVALIAVPTPTTDDHPDLSYIEAASKTIAAHLCLGATVILESTTYPGTTERVVVPILETSGLQAGREFRVGYAPERINPGTPITELRSVPKIVAGIDDESRAAVAGFWSGLVDEVVPAPDIGTAELAKLVENTFRLINISLVNELTRNAHALGIDAWQALALAATKPFGYMPFHPSAGAGGHCLPSDTRYLAWRIRETAGGAAPLIETAARINDDMPSYVASRIVAGIRWRQPCLASARAVVVGVTYKADIPDLRESAALKVVEALRGLGVNVVVVDPLVHADPDLAVSSELTVEHVAEAAVVALLVAHRDLDYALIAGSRYVFDACGVLPAAPNVERL
ncbi:nucleotide sugar dehydrogenase [Nocardia sp. NPDC058499]|uniref:nucleotide sugar dehydrogenase n=1 Tax=Nocardia sp. NPDC058499 TaxID=3346530 RepID=UPI0036604EBE